MKTMTCNEINGVCDHAISGETADEIASKSYAHIKELKDRDEGHKKLKATIDDMSDEEKQQWMEEFRQKFDASPDAE